MKIAQIRKINQLLAGYRSNVHVTFRVFVGGGISFFVYNLEHFVTQNGSHFTFANGKVIDSEVNGEKHG